MSSVRPSGRFRPIRFPALAASAAALLLVACSSLPFAEEPAAPAAPDAASTVRVHSDADGLRRATLAAIRALLREDRPAFVSATTTMKRATNPLPAEAADQLGESIRGFDVAFHSALDRVRENAAGDDMPQAFDNFFWVQRTCRACHAQGRERGLLPRTGPLWPADATPARP